MRSLRLGEGSDRRGWVGSEWDFFRDRTLLRHLPHHDLQQFGTGHPVHAGNFGRQERSEDSRIHGGRQVPDHLRIGLDHVQLSGMLRRRPRVDEMGADRDSRCYERGLFYLRIPGPETNHKG